MADFFILEQCAIGSALNALGFSIGLSLVFLLLHETPFLQSPQLSALVGRVRFHLPIPYIPIYLSWQSNLFIKFICRVFLETTDLIRFQRSLMTIGKKIQCLSFLSFYLVRLFLLQCILFAKNIILRCVNSIRLCLRHLLWHSLSWFHPTCCLL